MNNSVSFREGSDGDKTADITRFATVMLHDLRDEVNILNASLSNIP